MKEKGTVQPYHGEKGKYQAWHGDGKSQSTVSIVCTTMSMKTSGDPPIYVTKVFQKGKGFQSEMIAYTSAVWDRESGTDIIEAMIKALEG